MLLARHNKSNLDFEPDTEAISQAVNKGPSSLWSSDIAQKAVIVACGVKETDR